MTASTRQWCLSSAHGAQGHPATPPATRFQRCGRPSAPHARGPLRRGALRHDDGMCSGSRGERVVSPGANLATVTQAMVALELRRLAVVDDHGQLVGLLCRKGSGRGFCSDDGVAARAAAARTAQEHRKRQSGEVVIP